MVVSPMQKITLVTHRDRLSDLLAVLQAQGQVHLNNLNVMEEWQLPEETLAVASERDIQEDRLPHLQKRQDQLQKAVSLYQSYLPKQGILSQLQAERPRLSLEELEDQGQHFNEEVAIQRARHLSQRLKQLDKDAQALSASRDLLMKWRALSVLPIEERAEGALVNRAVGTVPSDRHNRYYQTLEALPDVIVERVFSTEEEVGLVVIGQRLMSQTDFLEQLKPAGFQALAYPFDRLPQEELPLVEAQLTQVETTLKEIRQELTQSQAQVTQLQMQLDYLANQGRREVASQQATCTEHLAAIEGWVEATYSQALVARVQEVLGSQVVVQLQEVDPVESDQVPVRLRNHPLIAPFEAVTRMYALPKYNEVDPTPFLAPFYWTFFGMMVADLGYGLLIMVASLVGLYLIKDRQGLRDSCKFYGLLGLSTAIWGAIYGSAFGYSLTFRLIDPNTDVTTILLLSVGLGFVQIMVGLMLNTYQKARGRDYHEAYTSGLAWIFILLGLLIMVVGMLLSQLSWLMPLGMGLALVNALGIVLVSILQAKSLGGLGSGLYNLYGISGYIGDFVSYTRLMALGLSGGSIGAAFNTIVSSLPVWGRFTIGLALFVLLHGLNIFLSMLSGYVHGARLMFVEFFGKFYQGGGQPFQPLAPVNQHVHTQEESEE